MPVEHLTNRGIFTGKLKIPLVEVPSWYVEAAILVMGDVRRM
jgi:hypothetical protein